jgi:hypothetical protein
MARLKKKRIRWEPPENSTTMKHRLYWAVGESVGYDSDYIEVQDVTEVILPDAIPPLPMKAQGVQLGISAVNDSGSESDITMLNTPLDFSIPEAPKNLQLLDLDIVPNSRNLQKLAIACLGIVVLTCIGVFALLKLGDRTLDHADKIAVGPKKNDYSMVTGGGMKSEEDSVSKTEVSPPSNGTQGSEVVGESGIDTSGFQIEAIIWSNDQMSSFALINGSKVRVGESVGEAIVTEIARDYVDFEAGDSRFRVPLR